MLQNTRNHFVASRFGLPTAVEALVFAPWTGATAAVEPDRPTAAPGATPATGPTAAPASTWVPAVDVLEDAAAIRLAFEVPGVDPDALDVTVDDGVLTVRGERTFARADGERGEHVYRLERRYGRFARSMTLPKTVDPDRIAARYEHGVLYLELPKRPEAQPRRITVAASPAPERVRDAERQRQIDAGGHPQS